MAQPLVSVIIPCYNQAHYLANAIETTLESSYSNLEIIVINDGSKDNILEIMDKYRDNPKIRLHNQENTGLSKARNKGIELARGELLQFLDSDDWLHPHKIEKQVKILGENLDIDLVYCDDYMVYNETELSERYSVNTRCYGPKEQDIFDSLWLQNIFVVHAALVRIEWVKKANGFSPEHSNLADWEFWLRLSAMGCKALFLNERLVYYRQHSASMSRDENDMLNSIYKVRAEIALLFPKRIAYATDFVIRRLFKLHDDTCQYSIPLGEEVKKLNDMYNSQTTYVHKLEQILSETQNYAISLKEKLDGLDSNRYVRLALKVDSGIQRVRGK
jgi:glycosyltransferase involved in cell wall biosynthesis